MAACYIRRNPQFMEEGIYLGIHTFMSSSEMRRQSVEHEMDQGFSRGISLINIPIIFIMLVARSMITRTIALL